MPANTTFVFDVEDRRARAAFSRLKREVDALQAESNQLQSTISERLLPVVSSATRGFAELFGNVTQFIQRTNDAKASVEGFTNALNTATAVGAVNKAFEDRIAFLKAEKAALDAAAEGRANYFSFSGQDTDTGRRYKEITTELERLQAAQGSLASQSEYPQKGITTELERLQAAQGSVASQSEYLQNVQNGLVTQARALTTEITALTNEIDGRTGKSVQGLHRQLRAKRQALAETQTQFATNANALRALAAAHTITEKATTDASKSAENYGLALAELRANAEETRNALNISINPLQLSATEKATTDASKSVENYGLALAELRANAEETRNALNISINPLQLSAGFQAALTASNAYYNARIEKAKAALSAETAGTEVSNNLQTRIFELGRQRLQAERQLNAENQRLLQHLSQERIDAATAASTAEVEGFTAATQAGQAYIDQLTRHINAMPRVSSPDAQDGNPFTSQLRQDFEETERQGRSLLDVMRQIANTAYGTDLDARIPDPIVRGAGIDERIAAEAQGRQTLLEIQQQAGEQGRQFLNTVLRREERDVQKSLRQQTRYYRQFYEQVSNIFIDLATGKQRSFESIATTFIQQSLRIVLRAFVEHQIQKRLDDTLTASKIANINKIAAAQSAAGAGGLGNLIGLGNLPGLSRIPGSALSGGGLALGAASLLFPTEIQNLTGGIKDTIGGLLSNVASIPDKAFAPQQIFLRIGDNEVREITDLQADLKNEARV